MHILYVCFTVDGTCYGLNKGEIQINLHVDECIGLGRKAEVPGIGYFSSTTMLIYEIIPHDVPEGKYY